MRGRHQEASRRDDTQQMSSGILMMDFTRVKGGISRGLCFSSRRSVKETTSQLKGGTKHRKQHLAKKRYLAEERYLVDGRYLVFGGSSWGGGGST